MLSDQINDTITKFTDAFHVNDLDRVMTFFSDDAIYEPGDGRTHRGKAQIRAAFEPQFNGAYGAMRFEDRDRVIDLENRKAAFRWVCRHDISNSRPKGLVMVLQNLIVGWSSEARSVGRESMSSISTPTARSRASLLTGGSGLDRTSSARSGNLLMPIDGRTPGNE